MAQASLPTYKTAAAFLERKNGTGLKMLGWTAARTLMIAPPMILVGVSAKRAFAGAALASALISVFALLRLYDAKGFGGGSRLAGTRRIRRRR